MEYVRTIADTIKVLAQLAAIVIVVGMIFAKPRPQPDIIGDLISQNVVQKDLSRHR
ncbi:MAG TPA: hypothetical protein VLJ17_24635 [Xanthobacteraceae bacterium]|nr:hypothetical protein [Xanthobacteraceae bacterium]